MEDRPLSRSSLCPRGKKQILSILAKRLRATCTGLSCETEEQMSHPGRRMRIQERGLQPGSPESLGNERRPKDSQNDVAVNSLLGPPTTDREADQWHILLPPLPEITSRPYLSVEALSPPCSQRPRLSFRSNPPLGPQIFSISSLNLVLDLPCLMRSFSKKTYAA